jgi:hypothetical protein
MPYTSKAKYTHHRQRKPKEFVRGTLKTVPLEHTEYEGRKFRKKGAKAIVGRIRQKGKKACRKYCWKVQSILIPKKGKK